MFNNAFGEWLIGMPNSGAAIIIVLSLFGFLISWTAIIVIFVMLPIGQLKTQSGRLLIAIGLFAISTYPLATVGITGHALTKDSIETHTGVVDSVQLEGDIIKTTLDDDTVLDLSHIETSKINLNIGDTIEYQTEIPYGDLLSENEPVVTSVKMSE